MVAGVKMPGIGVFLISSDFRELSFCAPCGHCFALKEIQMGNGENVNISATTQFRWLNHFVSILLSV